MNDDAGGVSALSAGLGTTPGTLAWELRVLAEEGSRVHSPGMPEYTICRGVLAALADIERLRAALEWYRDEAKALAKNMAGGAHTQGVLASVTVLTLDAGQRADAALVPNVEVTGLRRKD